MEYKREEETVTDSFLESLDKEFAAVMRELQNVDNIGRFRTEYEKLNRALRKSQESEKRLVQRCQELTQEMMSNAAKMQAAVKLSQGDHSTIEALKKEIEKAWRMVDAAQAKEARASETIRGLKQEVVSLKGLVEAGTSLSSGHQATLEELRVEHADLQVECEELVKQVEEFNQKLKDTDEQLRLAEIDGANKFAELQQVTERFAAMKKELERERGGRDRASTQVRELGLTLQARVNEEQLRRELVNKSQASVSKLKTETEAEKKRQTALLDKISSLEEQLYHTRKTYEDLVDTLTSLTQRQHTIDDQSLAADTRLAELRYAEQREMKELEGDVKELRRINQHNDDLRREHETMEQHKATLCKRIEAIRSAQSEVSSTTDLIIKEHAILKKQGDRERQKKERVLEVTHNYLESHGDLEVTLEQDTNAGNALKQTIAQLERDREKFIEASSQVSSLQAEAQQELSTVQVLLEEEKRRLSETEEKLTAQQKEYEHLRRERNQYSKKLVEVQDTISELKQKHGIMSHQVEQLREEFQIQEKKHYDELARAKIANEKLQKVRKQNAEYTTSLEEARKESEGATQHIRQLNKLIQECDKSLTAYQKQIVAVTRDRDLLGSQLVRRNDELALLYEKMRLQQQMLREGDVQAQERQEDARALALMLSDTIRNSAVAENRTKELPALKAKLKQTLEDFADEQERVKVISEDLENPKNPTRWRVVPGEDPPIEEVRAKLKSIQKRLLVKSEECIAKDLRIREKENLLHELETILERQPGPEVARQLNVYQRQLSKTGAAVKQRASELNASTTQISALKYEAERVRRELNEVTKKYYEYKVMNETLAGDPSTRKHSSKRATPQLSQTDSDSDAPVLPRRGGAHEQPANPPPAAALAVPPGGFEHPTKATAATEEAEHPTHDPPASGRADTTM